MGEACSIHHEHNFEVILQYQNTWQHSQIKKKVIFFQLTMVTEMDETCNIHQKYAVTNYDIWQDLKSNHYYSDCEAYVQLHQ
jgi:hypothetical protein